jgi:hypothetical protein
MGKLGRENVSVIGDPAVVSFTDLDGLVTVHPGSGEGWHLPLARELRAAGFDVDLNRL